MTDQSRSLRGLPSTGWAGAVPLWSQRTAEEIVALLSEDIARGQLAAGEGADIIRRVRARTQTDREAGTQHLPRPGAHLRPAEALRDVDELHEAG